MDLILLMATEELRKTFIGEADGGVGAVVTISLSLFLLPAKDGTDDDKLKRISHNATHTQSQKV